jgi:AraC family transcriptional regulator of adaptative response / DNA-3-methyladenine glycosylase II
LDRLFPTPDRLAAADLRGIGLTKRRAATVRGIAQSLLDGSVDLRPDRTLDDLVARWSALRGIGHWTAHYIAMRALGHADAFPAADLILRRTVADRESPPLSPGALLERAERWRPWRAYAVIHLWRSVSSPSPRTSKPARALP